MKFSNELNSQINGSKFNLLIFIHIILLFLSFIEDNFYFFVIFILIQILLFLLWEKLHSRKNDVYHKRKTQFLIWFYNRLKLVFKSNYGLIFGKLDDYLKEITLQVEELQLVHRSHELNLPPRDDFNGMLNPELIEIEKEYSFLDYRLSFYLIGIFLLPVMFGFIMILIDDLYSNQLFLLIIFVIITKIIFFSLNNNFFEGWEILPQLEYRKSSLHSYKSLELFSEFIPNYHTLDINQIPSHKAQNLAQFSLSNYIMIILRIPEEFRDDVHQAFFNDLNRIYPQQKIIYEKWKSYFPIFTVIIIVNTIFISVFITFMSIISNLSNNIPIENQIILSVNNFKQLVIFLYILIIHHQSLTILNSNYSKSNGIILYFLQIILFIIVNIFLKMLLN